MAIQPYQEESNVSNPIKRIGWATQRVTGAQGRHKRHSILDRFHHRRSGSGEKKRESADGPRLEGVQEEEETDKSEEGGDNGHATRRIFFNIPLSDDAKDAEGHPLAKYARNKIRTAKYTPLSFIPKNLWFQFHNIANIYFLFVIILAVRTRYLCSLFRADASYRTVFQYLRRIQCWTRLRASDRDFICYSCEGRY